MEMTESGNKEVEQEGQGGEEGGEESSDHVSHREVSKRLLHSREPFVISVPTTAHVIIVGIKCGGPWRSGECRSRSLQEAYAVSVRTFAIVTVLAIAPVAVAADEENPYKKVKVGDYRHLQDDHQGRRHVP